MKTSRTLLVAVIILLLFGLNITSPTANGTTIKLRAIDALGNADTIILTSDVSQLVDQINYYGVEPTKEVDLRIIQRSDTNYWRKIDPSNDHPDGLLIPYWLVPFEDVNIGDTLPNSRFYFKPS
jgi:hypothetical protein